MMAEGGSFSTINTDSIQHASGDADEVFCDPCKNKPQWIAVKGYCNFCKEYLCYNCLEVHKNQRLTKDHPILDKHAMPKKHESISSQATFVEICEEHAPELVRYYCVDHDETGCGDCMTLNHASCQKKRVQDIAAGFSTSDEFNEFLPKLVKLLEDIENMKTTLDYKLENIGTQYRTLLQTISDFRQKINDHLDQIQQQIEDQVTSLQETQRQELNCLIASNACMKSKIENALQKIEVASSDVSESSTFIVTKQAKREMVGMENELTTIELTKEQQQYDFCPSRQITDLIPDCISFGKLIKTPCIQSTVSYTGSFDVKTDSDRSICKINDCVFLCSDKMAATDGSNKKIKLIDLKERKIIFSYGAVGEPFGITTFKRDQVAVVFPAERTIEIFKVTTNLTRIRSIHLTRDCCGISYKDNKFAVSYSFPGGFEILDIQGNPLHTVEPMDGTEPMFQVPTFVSFGLEENTVVLSDSYSNKVCVVSFDGNVLKTCHLNDPRGFAITHNGAMLVSWGHGCVTVVSPDFKTKKVIVHRNEHVTMPQTITYCKVRRTLYVTNNELGAAGGNQIHAYKLDN